MEHFFSIEGFKRGDFAVAYDPEHYEEICKLLRLCVDDFGQIESPTRIDLTYKEEWGYWYEDDSLNSGLLRLFDPLNARCSIKVFYNDVFRTSPLLIEHAFSEYAEWALKTFDTLPADSCSGMIREVRELQKCLTIESLPHDKESEEHELADVLMYLFYIMARRRYSVNDVALFVLKKLEINKARNWNKNSDGTFSHIKDGTADDIRANYYGGSENPYEVIKVINAWQLDFELGNALKYIARAGKKNPEKHIEDLTKAKTYLNLEIQKLKE